MSHVVSIPPGGLGPRIKRDAQALPAAVRAGLRVAAERGRTYLVMKMPVYLGQLKNAWSVRERAYAVELVNDAPHAGIIERGARPHPVSPEGVEAIREWVRRKIVRVATPSGKARMLTGAEAADDPMVDSITNAIVWKLRKHGQEPTFVVRDSLPKLRRWVKAEVERATHRAAGAPVGAR